MGTKSIEGAKVNGVEYGINDEANAEIIARMQGQSAQNDSQKDPFVYLGTFDSVVALIARLDSLHSDTSATFAPNSGHFRARVSYSFFDIVSNARYIVGDIWTQAISGNLTLTDGTLVVSTNNYGTFVRYHDKAIGGWSAWTIANANEIMSAMAAIAMPASYQQELEELRIAVTNLQQELEILKKNTL